MKVDAMGRQSGIDDVAVGAKDAVTCLTEDRGQDRIIAVLSAFGQALLIDVGGHLLNAGFDLFQLERFGQIGGCPILDGFLGIFEFFVTGQKREFDVLAFLVGIFQNVDAVENRHIDIAKDQVGLFLIDDLFGHLAVVGTEKAVDAQLA